MDHMSEVFMAMVVFGAISYMVTQLFIHRQRMKMIETGITKLEFSQAHGRSANTIKYGLVAIALGAAILISQIADDIGAFHGREIGFALVPIFVGLALIISSAMERKLDKSAEGTSNDAVEMKR